VIHGIGTDICAVARMARMHERHGERLARRLLSPSEQAEYARSQVPERLLAKRFAAKEAYAKAMGTGLRHPVTLAGITVSHDELGRPALEFAPALCEHMKARGLRAHLSISDEAEFAVAFVVVERED
jgi:holo-[acyl-carrier protein] synthase